MELTEEMYEPGANLYTLVPRTDFNINNCATLFIDFLFNHEDDSQYHERAFIVFAKRHISEELVTVSTAYVAGNNTVSGMFGIYNNSIQLVGTFSQSDNYRLSIIGTGILYQ